MNSKFPVTVLSRFLGAEKITLLDRILDNRKGLKVSFIVNDIREIIIDTELNKCCRENLSQSEEELIEIDKSFIYCTARKASLTQVKRMVEEKKIDYLLIESTEISKPLPVSTTFDFCDENNKSLSNVVQLGEMITVVYDVNLIKNYSLTEFLKHKGESLHEDDKKTLVYLILEQIELTTIILLYKIDLMTKDYLDLPKKYQKSADPFLLWFQKVA